MVIKLSSLRFTDEDGIVPASVVERILNTEVANSIDDGNGTITGSKNLEPEFGSTYSIVNSDTLTDEDNDILTGTLSSNERRASSGFPNMMLEIRSIKCIKNGADSDGADDTYIKINGKSVWGIYEMEEGETYTVSHEVRYKNSAQPRIELFDKDPKSKKGKNKDDFMGGFTAETFSWITPSAQRINQVSGSGSVYEIDCRYSYLGG